MFQKGLSHIRSRRRVPDLEGSVAALQQWFETPIGKKLLAEQRQVLDQELSCLFGYHLMQLSVHRNVRLYDNSRVCHCFSVGAGQPDGAADVGAFSNFDELPLADETVDVTVLHHVLDFSHNPHQVLREASRVTIARGYIIIVGFNPFSLMGLVKPFAQQLSRNPVWRRNSLRQARIGDWLKFLDCNVVSAKTRNYNFPAGRETAQPKSGRFARMVNSARMPFGNFYCLVARKDRNAMIPIRSKWLAAPALTPRPKQAISARSAAKLVVIKGSKPSATGK